MLDNHPRKQLCFIIEKFGRSVINDSRRCRGLLKDLAPNHPRETNLLMLALEQKAVAELAEFNNSIPLSVQLERLAQCLHDNFGTQKEFAFWAVESWALALEDKSDDDAWLDELIAWADEKDILDSQFPRNKQAILTMTVLDLSYITVDDYYDDNCVPEHYCYGKGMCRERFEKIPDSISRLTNLTYLNLVENELTELPESIGKLINLTELDLQYNQLAQLPESIGKLSNLTALDLYCNELIKAPESIGHLTNLKKLDLGENQLTEIPEFIGKLSKLTSLRLSENQLTELPEFIGNLTNLHYLYLAGNKLTGLPKSICKLTNLTQLDLRNNPIKSLPTELSHLREITKF
jgi:hypothetical protein